MLPIDLKRRHDSRAWVAKLFVSFCHDDPRDPPSHPIPVPSPSHPSSPHVASRNLTRFSLPCWLCAPCPVFGRVREVIRGSGDPNFKVAVKTSTHFHLLQPPLLLVRFHSALQYPFLGLHGLGFVSMAWPFLRLQCCLLP